MWACAVAQGSASSDARAAIADEQRRLAIDAHNEHDRLMDRGRQLSNADLEYILAERAAAGARAAAKKVRKGKGKGKGEAGCSQPSVVRRRLPHKRSDTVRIGTLIQKL